MGLSTIGSMATHIVESLDVPTGVSGNMVEIVDMARQHVANYTGETIGSNSINAKFQPPILNLAKADTIDSSKGDVAGETIKIGELSVSESTGGAMSSQAFRDIAERQLKELGKDFGYEKTLI